MAEHLKKNGAGVVRPRRYMTKDFVAQQPRTKIVAYGGGVNSVALMLLLIDKGIRPDYILFSDTLGEKPGTYSYNDMFSDYLQSINYPPITKLPPLHEKGLYNDCIENKRMPSIVYGFKTCSEVWKRRPYIRFCNKNNLWPVTCFKGYDAGEPARVKPDREHRESMVFPLVEAEMDREDCINLILSKGLPVPPKSACFFCPASSPEDVRSLPTELQKLAVQMEQNAKKNAGGVIRGLGFRHRWEDWLKVQTLFELPAKSPIKPCMKCHE